VTDLGSGSIASVPALWTAPGPQGPWTLVRLPASQAIAEAHAARCGNDRCLVVGADGDRLAVWDVEGAKVTLVATPSLNVAEKQAVPPPVEVRGSDLVAVPGAVLQRTSSGWSQRSGPPGLPVAAAAAGDVLHLVTTDSEGSGRLWSVRP
jgi:hypothetical protein